MARTLTVEAPRRRGKKHSAIVVALLALSITVVLAHSAPLIDHGGEGAAMCIAVIQITAAVGIAARWNGRAECVRDVVPVTFPVMTMATPNTAHGPRARAGPADLQVFRI